MNQMLNKHMTTRWSLHPEIFFHWRWCEVYFEWHSKNVWPSVEL